MASEKKLKDQKDREQRYREMMEQERLRQLRDDGISEPRIIGDYSEEPPKFS